MIPALARNTCRPDTIILCDDASSDQSIEVFRSLCLSHNLRYDVAAHPDSSIHYRLNTLRNSGIALCEEGLVIIQDADHVVSRTCIEAHVAMQVNNAEKVISTGPRLEYAFSNCTGPINFMWGHEAIGMLPSSPLEPDTSFPAWQTVVVSTIGVMRDSVVNLGGFDPQYDGNYGYDDLDFTWRAHQAGYNFVADWEAHIIHIPHPSNREANLSINRQKFEAKYGFSVTYPRLIKQLGRPVWSEYYQLVRQGKMPITSLLADLPLTNQDLEFLSGRLLLRALRQKLLFRLGFRA